MTKEVVIKSNKYGINLVLDDKMDFEDLLPLIGQTFRESENFFRDASMAIAFEGRELTDEEEARIIDVISQNCSVKIVSILDENKDHLEAMKRSVDLALRDKLSAPEADFYKGNLRSGQTLECESSVTLVGDVNPGAKIVSRGNIVVLGSLKGNAHAGSEGARNCFIFALDMRPIQLQIGDLIAKSPDKNKSPVRFGKRARQQTDDSFASRVALVKDGFICIEPMTKGCLDKL